nr:uncharacterized protein LOC104109986 isoform X2 [Nicotiana tomentosiformis]
MARRKRRPPQVYTPTITTKVANLQSTLTQSPNLETEERDTQEEVSVKHEDQSKPKSQMVEEASPKARSVRQITPALGVIQNLAPIQLASWILGAANKGDEGNVQPARKLNFVMEPQQAKPTMAERDIDEQKQKWQSALIGYVTGGAPKFKGILQFVYGVWQFVATPRVFMHDDGYFIFKFEIEEDKACVLQNGSYTFRNRPMILKQWSPDFQMQKEPLRVLPIRVCLSCLPLLYWSKENLGRIASFLGKPICTDSLTAKGERISYARLLTGMDITQTLSEVINVEASNGSIWNQKIEYEWKPILCHKCLRFGHNNEQCPKQK